MPNKAWTIIKGYYDESHINCQQWATAETRYLAKWDICKSLSVYIPFFNNAVTKLNELEPLIPDRQAPNGEAVRRQFLENGSTQKDDHFKIQALTYKNSQRNVLLEEVQQNLIEVDPVSKKLTQVNHNVEEAAISAAGVAGDNSLIKGPSGVYYNIHYPVKLLKKMTKAEKDDLFSSKGKTGDRVTVDEAKRQSSSAKSWLEQLEKRSNPSKSGGSGTRGDCGGGGGRGKRGG